MESFIMCLIFLAGAFFAIFVTFNNYILAPVVAICAFILIFGMAQLMKKQVNEVIIKKLCYIYAFMSMIPSNDVAKQIRRVLKELAMDACGPGHYSYWLKWEAYFKNELNKHFEEDK